MLKQLWNQCADGHLSQADVESSVVIYIFTRFLDLELLLQNTLLTDFFSISDNSCIFSHRFLLLAVEMLLCKMNFEKTV